jgi:hypothetical protein
MPNQKYPFQQLQQIIQVFPDLLSGICLNHGSFQTIKFWTTGVQVLVKRGRWENSMHSTLMKIKEKNSK